MKEILLSVAFMLLVIPAVFNSNDISAQTVTVKVGTGQVTLVTYQRGEPVRWNILRDRTPDDIIYDEQAYNYQLVRYGDGNDNILLININTGAMWAIDTKGLTFSYKNTRLKYIPAVDTSW